MGLWISMYQNALYSLRASQPGWSHGMDACGGAWCHPGQTKLLPLPVWPAPTLISAWQPLVMTIEAGLANLVLGDLACSHCLQPHNCSVHSFQTLLKHPPHVFLLHNPWELHVEKNHNNKHEINNHISNGELPAIGEFLLQTRSQSKVQADSTPMCKITASMCKHSSHVKLAWRYMPCPLKTFTAPLPVYRAAGKTGENRSTVTTELGLVA